MSIVISNTPSHKREGWQYIDLLSKEEICSPPASAPLPIGLHYCKRYMLDKTFFSKYRLKKKYISCESPLLKNPPPDLAMKEYTVAYAPPPHGYNMEQGWNPANETVSLWQSKREAFMLCALIPKINEAAIHFKQSFCQGKANMDYYDLFNDPDH
jgi:hypothetical protein